MPTTEHFAEKNIIYGMKNITLKIFFKPLILAYFERKKAISVASCVKASAQNFRPLVSSIIANDSQIIQYHPKGRRQGLIGLPHNTSQSKILLMSKNKKPGS